MTTKRLDVRYGQHPILKPDTSLILNPAAVIIYEHTRSPEDDDDIDYYESNIHASDLGTLSRAVPVIILYAFNWLKSVILFDQDHISFIPNAERIPLKLSSRYLSDLLRSALHYVRQGKFLVCLGA